MARLEAAPGQTVALLSSGFWLLLVSRRGRGGLEVTREIMGQGRSLFRHADMLTAGMKEVWLCQCFDFQGESRMNGPLLGKPTHQLPLSCHPNLHRGLQGAGPPAGVPALPLLEQPPSSRGASGLEVKYSFKH